jgi:type II secretory pathway pseudopilin PulG
MRLLDRNPRDTAPPRSESREAGFTMLMLVVVVAIMAIMMGVAVQSVEFQMRREREAELIFRGKQYVEAIRLYKTKYGRYPMQLKEIWEAKPRVVRKKWKDPITDSQSWGLIYLGQEGRQIGGPGGSTDPAMVGTPVPQLGKDDEDGEQGSRLPTGLEQPGDKDKIRIGPIVGVHSTSCDESIKVFEGRTTYCEWRFIYREEQQRGGPRGGRFGGGRPRRGYHGGDHPPGETEDGGSGSGGGTYGGGGSRGGGSRGGPVPRGTPVP